MFNLTEDIPDYTVTRLVAECGAEGWILAPLNRDTGEIETQFQQLGSVVPECSEY